jgi:hypothetical protein
MEVAPAWEGYLLLHKMPGASWTISLYDLHQAEEVQQRLQELTASGATVRLFLGRDMTPAAP